MSKRPTSLGSASAASSDAAESKAAASEQHLQIGDEISSLDITLAPLEVRLKRLNNSLNKIRHLQKCWDERFICTSHSWIEHYVNSAFNIVVEFSLHFQRGNA